ncbi:MAG: ATP synthase F1 subunit delta [Cytophagales bacterium]|nr:MAG: ATP synthase F1 subunit delta [Cytophagales bacterium]
MINYRVSSAYAKSLLELAQEKNVLGDVYNDMVLISNTFQNSFELRKVSESPIIGSLKKAEIFKQIFQNKINILTTNFITIISIKGRESALFGIAKEFVLKYKSMNGIQPATVTTAVAIDSILEQQISSFLSKISDKKLEITSKVNTSIIGGFIVSTGGLQYDASVKSKLSKFKNQFTSNPYISKI